MDELRDAQALGGGGHTASPVLMDGREGLRSHLRENADQIDDCVGPLDWRPDTFVIENVRLDVLDPGPAQRLYYPMERMARRDPY